MAGRYSVSLPDGRLMVVDYTADSKSGYVPRISFINNANPVTRGMLLEKRIFLKVLPNKLNKFSNFDVANYQLHN